MKFTILTLFKEAYSGFLATSIIKKAIERKLVEVELVDIRDYSLDKHRHVDDTPYGGGAGMLMSVEPIYRALKDNYDAKAKILLTSPKAKPYTQVKAQTLAQEKHIIIICGHYEGIDARVELLADEMISIGDYVLTGGELPSMVVMDSIIRLLDDAISPGSLLDESYTDGLLEYPQYTRPYAFMGHKVPDVLLSGNHELIRRFRLKSALLETLKYRKDLLLKRRFSDEEKALLKEIEDELKRR